MRDEFNGTESNHIAPEQTIANFDFRGICISDVVEEIRFALRQHTQAHCHSESDRVYHDYRAHVDRWLLDVFNPKHPDKRTN